MTDVIQGNWQGPAHDLQPLDTRSPKDRVKQTPKGGINPGGYSFTGGTPSNLSPADAAIIGKGIY